MPGAINQVSNNRSLLYTVMTHNAVLGAGQGVTGDTNDFIFAQVNSARVTVQDVYISVSDDATCCDIMKSRLGVCDANTASWPVSSSPLTALMPLYPAACHCAALALLFIFLDCIR